MAEENNKYSAFISYKHGDLDTFVAENLHKAIETFKVPRNIQKKTGRKKIERVFRDKDELPISSNLAENISDALQHSEYLIVVCSPRTPESYWVQKEIETFIGMHDREHVLAILIEGEPEEAFPEQLRYAEQVRNNQDGTLQVERIPVEPLAADLRSASKKELKKKLNTEILRIMAPLLGCGYDDLRQRHRERKMRRMIGICAAASVLFLAFGLYSAYNTMQINRQYRVKQENQSRYLAETSQRLLGEGDRELAVKIALEALPEYEGSDDRPYVPEAEYALSDALHVYETGSELCVERQLICESEIKNMICSPDNSLLLAQDSMQNVYVWDTENFELLFQLKPEFDERFQVINRKFVSFNNQNQVICVTDSAVECWDCQTGEMVWKQEIAYISHCTFNKDKNLAAIFGFAECVVVDIQTGEILCRTDTYPPSNNMSFSPDNQYLAYDVDIENRQAVAVWDIKNNQVELLEYEEWNNAYVLTLNFVGKRNLIVSYSVNADSYLDVSGKLTMFNVETKEPVWSQDEYVKELSTYYSQADKEYEQPITIYISNSSICLINVQDGSVEEMSAPDNLAFVKPTSFNSFITVTTGGTAGVLLREEDAYMSFGEVKGDTQVDDCILVNERLLYHYSESNRITVNTQPVGSEFQFCSEGLYGEFAQCSSDGRYMLMQISDTIKVLSMEDFSTVDEIPVGYAGQRIYGFCQESNQIVYIDDEGEMHRYDPEQKKDMESVKVAEGMSQFVSFDFSEDGNWFVYTDGQKIEAYNTSDFSQCYQIEDVDLSFLRISWDGAYVIGRKLDGTLGIYEVMTGKEINIQGDSFGVMAQESDREIIFATAHSREMAAVCCTDNEIRVVELSSGKILYEAEISVADQAFVEFTLNDDKLMVADIYNSLTLYDLSSNMILKQISIRNKTVQEVSYLPEQELCVVKCDSEAYILSTKNQAYSIIACVPDFFVIDENTNRIFVDRTTAGFGYFPYQSLDNLINQGNELVNYEELTELEKKTYNVE